MPIPIDLKHGPIVALVMELSNAFVDMLQNTHDEAMAAGEHEIAKDASIALERICLLRSMVELTTQRETSGTVETDIIISEITAYLQANDPDVFPIRLFEKDKQFHLDTTTGVSGDTAQVLDDKYAGLIVLYQPVRASAPHRFTITDQVIRTDLPPKPFNPTRAPGFIPERQPTPPVPDGMPEPKNPAINSGMPMDGEQQGLPGGRLGNNRQVRT